MSDADFPRVLCFDKRTPNGILRCELEVFEDDSAYLNGDEIEMIFEGSSDAWKKGVEYLESRGYQQEPEGPT